MTVILQPDYQTRCPNCAGQLYPVVLGPDSAPWLCAICRRSWWVAELSPEARAMWRHPHQDHGYGIPAKALAQAIADERLEAEGRGTSARPEMVPLLPVEGLRRLRMTAKAPEVTEACEAALATHGAA